MELESNRGSGNAPPKRLVLRTAAFAVLLLIVATALLVIWRIARPRLSLETLQTEVITTLQRESEASFLITGTLDIVATTSVANTRELLPGLFDVNLGTSRATVQVPGRAHYGFDVRALKPEQIKLLGDSVIEINVPTPQVYSVEPNLSEMRVWTSKGWARSNASIQSAERKAISLLNGALMQQAKAHVATSMQPRVNTSRALQRLLTPVVKSLGMDNPVFRFTIGEQLIMEPAGRN